LQNAVPNQIRNDRAGGSADLDADSIQTGPRRSHDGEHADILPDRNFPDDRIINVEAGDRAELCCDTEVGAELYPLSPTRKNIPLHSTYKTAKTGTLTPSPDSGTQGAGRGIEYRRILATRGYAAVNFPRQHSDDSANAFAQILFVGRHRGEAVMRSTWRLALC
jgi:hypothetical protein